MNRLDMNSDLDMNSSLLGSCWGAAHGSAGPLCTDQLWKKGTIGQKSEWSLLLQPKLKKEIHKNVFESVLGQDGKQ